MTSLILFTPLIVLQTALSFFLFIDKLIQGEYTAAFKTLLSSPIKALLTLILCISLALERGWIQGFTQIIQSSFLNGEEQAACLEKLASYLSHIQRGFQTPFDFTIPDAPECPTGALGLLLSVLNPDEQPSSANSTERMQRLLNEKMQQQYNVMHNTIGSMRENWGVAKGRSYFNRVDFLNQNRAVIKYYAHFLVETPQGKKITGLSADLDAITIDDMVDVVIDSWKPNIK